MTETQVVTQTKRTRSTEGLLRAHIQDAQDKAMQLNGVLEAIDALKNSGEAPNGEFALVRIAWDLAGDLNNFLDSTNLPEFRTND